MHKNITLKNLGILLLLTICISCSMPIEKGGKIEPVDLINKVRTGVARVIMKCRDNKEFFGTAFLVEGGIVTNSHNIRQCEIDTFILKFEDNKSFIILSAREFNLSVCAESLENDKDYIYIKVSRPEFSNRHVFEFIDSSNVNVGEQILFLGYPFGQYEYQLTSHLGYISSIFEVNGVRKIKLDGSVNGGNSGGPLLDLKTGKVVGIITQTNIGFVVQEFNNLIKALQQNQVALEQAKGLMNAGGIDPFQAIKASQSAMEKIAINLKQSANVGIGYAYSSDYVRDDIIKKRVVPK